MSVTEKTSCKWRSGEVAKWPCEWPSGPVAKWPKSHRRPVGHWATGPLGHSRGQSLIEYAVLVAAVTAALVVMSDYVRRAFNAHAESVEEELNGATDGISTKLPGPPPN